MVIPTLKKINPGIEPKDGKLDKAKSCSCKDPSLLLRKEFKTSEPWEANYADPSTQEFQIFKKSMEEKVSDLACKFD